MLCWSPAYGQGAWNFKLADQPISRLVRTAVALGSTQFAIADFDGDASRFGVIRATIDGSPTRNILSTSIRRRSKAAIRFVGPAGGMQISREISTETSSRI